MNRLFIIGVVAAPGVAVACGACQDTLLHQRSWLWGAVGWAFLALVVDAFAAGGLAPTNRWTLLVSRGGVVAAAIATVGCFLIAPVFAGLCGSILLLARSICLAVFSMKTRRNGTVLRLSALGVAVLVALVHARAPYRSTEELLGVLTDTPYVLAPIDGWAVDEFVHRPDSLPRVQQLLAAEPDQISPSRLLVVAELHARLGGPQSELRAACARLRETWPKYRDPEVNRMRALCGPTSERDGHAK